jgi:hypothetical protein
MTRKAELAELETENVRVPQPCFSRKCGAMSGYIKESNLRINLERQNKKLKEQNVLYKTATGSLLAMIKDLLSPNYPAVNFVRERLRDISAVSKAYYFVSDAVVNLWFFTEKEDFDAEMRIADTFCELASIFTNMRFDLMVIPKAQTQAENLLPSDIELFFSRT